MFSKSSMAACYKSLDKVVQLCQRRGLDLTKRSPYILDIIPDIFEKLQLIVACYQENYDELGQIEYFKIYLESLVENCNRTVTLFKTGKENILNIHSKGRRYLMKLSLIFLHLLKDLEALFPNNLFDPTGFRITKSDAARWWSLNFGSRVIVSWKDFELLLLQDSHIGFDNLVRTLQSTIDITCNQHVSIFEFDLFTRLFQPWNNILNTWKSLVILHPGYKAFMTYDEAKVVLKQYRTSPGPGSYIFRLSCTKLGQWAIGFVGYDFKIRQTIIQNKSLIQSLVDGEREGYYLYPNGKSFPLSVFYHLLNNLIQVRLQVTKEQYQLYFEIGSSFEICKICDENNKNVQLEPCGHLLCKSCLLNWQSFENGQKCPFCRLEIKDIETVIIEPYKPDGCDIQKSFLPNRKCSLNTLDKIWFLENLFAPSFQNDEVLSVAKPFTSTSNFAAYHLTETTDLFLNDSTCPEDICDERASFNNVTSSMSKPSNISTTSKLNSISNPNLNYAQLDLSNCDSDDGQNADVDGPSNNLMTNSVLNDSKCSNIFSTSVGSSLSNDFSNFSLNMDEIGRMNFYSKSNLIDDKLFDKNVQQLVNSNEDMTRVVASRLLNITGNRLNMSQKVWDHFMSQANV